MRAGILWRWHLKRVCSLTMLTSTPIYCKRNGSIPVGDDTTESLFEKKWTLLYCPYTAHRDFTWQWGSPTNSSEIRRQMSWIGTDIYSPIFTDFHRVICFSIHPLTGKFFVCIHVVPPLFSIFFASLLTNAMHKWREIIKWHTLSRNYKSAIYISRFKTGIPIKWLQTINAL